MKVSIPARRSDGRHDWGSRGQVIVVFAITLVVMVSMLGLIIDGGGAYSQSRSQQTAADLAALAGANEYLLNSQSDQALALAASVAQTNGYTNGTTTSDCPSIATTVGTSLDTTTGRLTVTVTAPHVNTFARVLGMACWPVTTTATAQAGIPDSAAGVGPILFNIAAFGTNGQPSCDDPANPCTFTHGQAQDGDAPAGASNMSWTDWSFTANDNTAIDQAIIQGTTVINKTLAFGEYIGQHNDGQHAALFGYTNVSADPPPGNLPGLKDASFPVAIVDSNGNFMGWATFHLVSASQGDKSLTGYFVSPFLNQNLSVGTCHHGHCPRYLGSYSLSLVN